jgi:hypothetical protein
MFRKIAPALASVILWLMVGIADAAEGTLPAPNASIEFSGGSAAAIVGVTWGSGIIRFNGKNYPFRIGGLAAGQIGGAKIHGLGKVYNLKQIDDIEGTFVSHASGSTVVYGETTATMRNDNGVEIQLDTRDNGFSFKFATEGIKIRLER